MEVPPKIEKIVKDIEDLKVQGATAVAEASFEGIKLFLEGYSDDGIHFDVFMSEVEKIGLKLVNARPNEPLARNGYKYIMNMFKIRHPEVKNVEGARKALTKLMDEFLQLLVDAKKKIVEVGVAEFADVKGIMTHCHSSTVENVCKGIDEHNGPEDFSVVASETRPRFQGRITAKNLFEAGVKVKLIVDDAVTSFLVGHWDVPIETVFIGCDQINIHGDVINKIGSYSLALSSYYANMPIYVVGTLLKLDPSSIYDHPKIEMRDPKEVWPDAPEGLPIINPAFEIVPHQLITGFVTEFGVIPPEQVEKELGKHYDWLW